ncbi:MAG: peptidoglycan editing factor PgeF [Clostridia bacterium]|nr:peptidoglycan editing factor PgeF [Clostridia bacterium]
MQKNENGKATWFSSRLFCENGAGNIRSYPHPVENSVDKTAFSCGKTPEKHVDSMWKTSEDAEERQKYRLCHGFSTRHGGGVSTDPYLSDMNFGFSVGEDRALTKENYRRFAASLGIGEDHPVCAWQTHTNLVYAVTQADRGMGIDENHPLPGGIYADGFDALVTREPGLALTIRTADCVPILFWDPVHAVIGAAHAGWKGTLGCIAENTVSAMEALGAKRRDILVSVGNAVGLCCYEIDDAFYERFLSVFGADICERVFAKSADYENPDRFHCDLRLLNQIILEKAGVPSAHIEVSPFCTCCQPDVFFSHRYAVKHQGGKRGLMAAMIAMERVQWP